MTAPSGGSPSMDIDNNPRCYMHLWCRFFVKEAKFDETHLFVEHILQVPIRIVAWRTVYITDYVNNIILIPHHNLHQSCHWWANVPGKRWASGTNGKNLFCPSLSLESPAFTPRFSIHLPASHHQHLPACHSMDMSLVFTISMKTVSVWVLWILWFVSVSMRVLWICERTDPSQHPPLPGFLLDKVLDCPTPFLQTCTTMGIVFKWWCN